MRYFFDIAIAFRQEHPEKDSAWWRLFHAWQSGFSKGVMPVDYGSALVPCTYFVQPGEGAVAVFSHVEIGVSRETFDGILGLVQRYLREVPNAAPVGFSYSSMELQRTSLAEPFRQYGGGAVFITKDKIYEETASDRLIAIQERVAKMGDEVETEDDVMLGHVVEGPFLHAPDDVMLGRIHPALEIVVTHDAIVEHLPVLMSFEDAYASGQAYAAANPCLGGFDIHSYVASAMFGFPYAQFVCRKDAIIVPEERHRDRLEALRGHVKKRAFAHACGASSSKLEEA